MTRLMVATAVFGAVFAAAVCAQATDKNTDQASKTSTAVTTASPAKPPLSIPKEAVKNPDGTYSYTDSQGRKWLYVNTPFGVMSSAVKDTGSQAAPRLSPGTKLIDKGDTVRFEQPGPFGVFSWEKKKTDLTDQERQMLEAQNQTVKPDAK